MQKVFSFVIGPFIWANGLLYLPNEDPGSSPSRRQHRISGDLKIRNDWVNYEKKRDNLPLNEALFCQMILSLVECFLFKSNSIHLKV